MKKIIIAFSVVFIMASFLGCSTNNSITNQIQGSVLKLEKGAKVFIVMPVDGGYGNSVAAGSGSETAILLKQALTPFTSETILSNSHITENEALEIAKAQGYRYVFYPIITNWEHRVAAWSGIPTRVSLTIAVYDGLSLAKLRQDALDVRGRIVTFKSQFPKEVAESLIKTYVREIF